MLFSIVFVLLFCLDFAVFCGIVVLVGFFLFVA